MSFSPTLRRNCADSAHRPGPRKLPVMPTPARKPARIISPGFMLLWGLLAVALAGGVTVKPVLAQQVWVRAYESVEDLWESYLEGEITEEQYRELLGLFHAGIDSVFQPLGDLEELPGYSVLDSLPQIPGPSLVDQPTRHTGAARYELRWGYTLPVRENVGEEGYLIARRRSDNINFLFESYADEGRVDGLRRRGITYSIPQAGIHITVGNFEPRCGLGLVVGRRDRVLGRSEQTRMSGSIWQPKRGKYNGMYLQLKPVARITMGAFGSRIENARYRENLCAWYAALNGREGKTNIELTGAIGRVSDHEAKRRFDCYGFGLSASHETHGRKLAAETAVSNGDAVACALQAVQPVGPGQFSLTLWSYDPGYILLSSGGPGHPGRCRVWILDDDLDYYSRTAGEQGLLLAQRTPVSKRVRVESVLEIFNERLNETRNVEGNISCRVKPAPRVSIAAYLRGRNTHGPEGRENRLYVGGYGTARLLQEWSGTWRMEFGTVEKTTGAKNNSLRLELQTTFPINRFTFLNPRIRFVDPDVSTPGDGYFYAYVTERITLYEKTDLELVVVIKGYENSSKKTFADVRLRMNWRP